TGDDDPAPKPHTVYFNYRDHRPSAEEVRTPAGGSAKPRPIRQVNPAVPPNLTARLKDEVEFDVRVHIDRTGKVTRAQLISRRGPSGGTLSASAVSAAMLWRCQPALKGGRPVASNTVLSFRFEP